MKRSLSVALVALAAVFVLSIAPIGAAPHPIDQQKGQGQARPAAPPAAGAQAANQKAEEQPLEQPADFKAFNDAMKTPETGKRIEALQKFVKDFPDSTLKSNAESQVKALSLNQAADFTKKYLAALDKSLKEAKGADAIQIYTMAASELNRAGILLEQAEEYATKALQYNDVAKYIADYRANQKSQPSDTGKLPPNTAVDFSFSGGSVTATLVRSKETPSTRRELTDDDLRSRFRSQRTQLQTTLGQIYLKRGKTAEAEKTLKALYTDTAAPFTSRAAAARSLAEIARKSGDEKGLMEYLTVQVLAGASPDVRKEFDELYKKTHNNSLDGVDAMLDDRYRASVKPLEVKPYVRPATKNGRTVLAELLTGAACPPCVGADIAFDAVLERYSRNDVAVVVYHQHIPGPDPMTNPSTQARGAKEGIYNLQGVPTFAIDGLTAVGGGGAEQAQGIFKNVSENIEKQLNLPAEARLQLKARVVGSTIRVSAGVSDVTSKSDKLKLQIALVEEQQRYSGPNGVRFHPMVVRSLAGPDAKGFAVSAARGLQVEHVFDLAKILADNKKATEDFLSKPFRESGQKPSFTEGRRDEIDPNHLMIVAFVQDEDTNQKAPEGGRQERLLRKVLQAAFVKVPPVAKKTTN